MTDVRATRLTVVGLFFITLATMMLEILLTRIFSVTMWYHFAFVAISLAMFGMTVGALQVYRHPERYDEINTKQQMALSALWFAITAIVSVLAHVLVPFRSQPTLAVIWIAVTYFVLAVPFYFSGVCVCVALTKFPRSVSGLYAADLFGAATGCIVLIYVLKITDAPTAVVLVGLLGCMAAVFFAADAAARQLRKAALTLGTAFAIFVVMNTILAQRQESLLRLTWAKGEHEPPSLYEKWNSFSRITVRGDANTPSNVITEGISVTYPTDRPYRQLHLKIDSDAETTLTALSGVSLDNPALDNPDDHSLDYLRYDVKNIVHYIRSDANVLIIGAGGGRDVLSALLFKQKSVRAVEINQNILSTVNGRFGDFTGHLDRNPKVTFVNDEARSYLARTPERFDILEASFIDTWAATAAGALTLTENSLYTVECWNMFLHRLTPDGVLSFSRWYLPGLPAEAYRLTSLAAAALRTNGVADPRSHMLLVKNSRRGPQGEPIGAVTILIGKKPFTSAEIDRIEAISRQMQFDVVLSPRFALDPVFAALASGQDAGNIIESLPVNLSAPTDDSPFFFYMMKFRNLFRMKQLAEDPNAAIYATSGAVVGVLLLIVTVPTLICIVLPLRSMPKKVLRSALPHLLFFAAIGLGFMLIEISQMQRLIVFLGHPTYALSVVLFSLLLSSGLGSYTTGKFTQAGRSGVSRLLMLLVAMLVFGVLTPYATSAFASSENAVRIAVAAGILFPLGIFMGMAFPLGLKLAASQVDELTPAFWGVNGATSICGSVLAAAISMNAGIASTFWSGFLCYVFALGAYLWASRGDRAGSPKTLAPVSVLVGNE
jgi:spermidine synthase